MKVAETFARDLCLGATAWRHGVVSLGFPFNVSLSRLERSQGDGSRSPIPRDQMRRGAR